MAIIPNPGPAKGVPLEGLKKAFLERDFFMNLTFWGHVRFLENRRLRRARAERPARRTKLFYSKGMGFTNNLCRALGFLFP